MKTKEIRELSQTEIESKLRETREQLLQLRLRKQTGQMKSLTCCTLTARTWPVSRPSARHEADCRPTPDPFQRFSTCPLHPQQAQDLRRLRHQPHGRKSIKVTVHYRTPHAKYQKVINRQTVVHAHDEKNEAKVGDQVEVMETRPLSRLKRWRWCAWSRRPSRIAQAISEQDVAQTVPTKLTPAPVPAASPAEAAAADTPSGLNQQP